MQQGEQRICASELVNALVKREHRGVLGKQSQSVGRRTREGWRDKSGLKDKLEIGISGVRALGHVKKESDHIGWGWEGVFLGCPAELCDEGREVPSGRDHSS